MNTKRKLVACGALVLSLSGCASVLPMTEAGSHVQQISTTTAKTCQFLQVVQFSTTLYGMGKDLGIVQTTGENGLRNAVAAAGGNAYVLIAAHADWFLGHVAYSGSAYRCHAGH